jgi:hypothetical protein
MAIKKALYGRQPVVFTFLVCFYCSCERVIFFESFLCPFCIKQVCFSMSTVAKIKCQVLPILDVLRLQYLLGVAEICVALFSARFSYVFYNSYGPVLFL